MQSEPIIAHSDEEEARWIQNERHGDLLGGRLCRLVQKGYRPVFEPGGTGWFELKHPNPNAVPVHLWTDGQLVDASPTTVKADSERTIIYPEDERLFAQFLSQVPEPTLFQRLLDMRVGDVATYVIAWSLFIGLILLLGELGRAVWRAVR